MALFDDRRFLLSHINHSFITGDDTGLCEVVMLDEEVFKNQHERCLILEGQESETDESNKIPREAYDLNYETDLLDPEQAQSYDIISDMDYICHRRRSNTAQRLERLRKEKNTKSKTRTIVWKHNTASAEQIENSTPNPISEAIEERESDDSSNQNINKNLPDKSGLTKLLEKYPLLPRNPFDEYAQFDGGMSETMPVKKMLIFICLSSHKQLQQMEVVIVSTARVQDLIGLICWQYTNESREPKLTGHINDYCLRIAEDNGEVDPDFTSLNSKESLCKFNFPCLALTEKSDEKARTNDTESYQGSSVSSRQLPSRLPQHVIASTNRVSTYSRLAAFTRIIFRDAKLDVE